MESKKFYCGNCGKAIDNDAVSCPYCGAFFDEGETTEIRAIAKPEVTFDTKVEKTVLGLEKVANVIKVLSIIAAILVLVGGIIGASEAEIDGGEIFLTCLIWSVVLLGNAYISYLMFNWLSHSLNCLYQITKRKK